MSRFPSWHFRTMDAGEVHVDPVHDEFFKMQDLADALVRESIQNSLDARRGRSPVRVRFFFGSGTDALSPEAARQYFVGLREHIDAASILSIIPREEESVPYLLIEDFGTRGLTGDPAIDPEIEADTETKNDFYYFWRNVGRNKKSELDRGRWGLGKAVFSVASRIRTIFGLTRRADDARALLLGQAVLKTHIMSGTRMYPYGFVARFDRPGGMPLPIENPLLLERFADDFRLARTEPGLSVVVPYFRADELSFERIIDAAIRQYFYPIMRGDLVVDVEEGPHRESITARTIDEVAARHATGAADGIAHLTALTRWALTEAAEQRVQIGEGVADRAPKWNEDIFDKATLEELRTRFDRGEPVAVRAPIFVKKKRSRTSVSYFDIVIQKDETLRKPEFHFIRRGITIPDVKGTATSEKAARALVIVDHDALSTFLGDAENPAHSEWSERADKLRMLYDLHAGTLRYVKNSAAFLASLLNRPPEGRVRDFLGHIFSIDIVDDETTADSRLLHARESQTGESAPANGGDGKSRTPRITIVPAAGGFTIKGSGDASLVARPFTVEMAYRVRNGNPFKKHSAFDFDARGDQLTLESAAANANRTGVNSIEFVPASAKFHITMKGFDPHRDLLVRVVERTSDAAEAELH